LKTISNALFTFDKNSNNDNVYFHLVDNDKIFVVIVSHFVCGIEYNREKLTRYDIRDPKYKILNPKKHAQSIVTTTNDWKNIKYKTLIYPK
jgi:hypothetical protein